MKKIYALLFTILLFCSIIPPISAVEEHLVYGCDTPEDPELCFKENPTAETLAGIEEPSTTLFEYLVQQNPDEAAFYLIDNYDTEFALYYLNSFDVSTASEKQAIVAEEFFSEKAENINNNKIMFEGYMNGKGVSIIITGEIVSYSKKGVLKAKNGQINIKDFADKYEFRVTKEDELVIIMPDSGDWYAFEGTLTKSRKENIGMVGEGSIRYYTMSEPIHIKNAGSINLEDNGIMTIFAKEVGSLEFKQNALVIYNPGTETYTLKDAILEDYPQYQLTGTITFEKGTVVDTMYVPADEYLTIKPTTTNPKYEPLKTHVYEVQATAGKRVEIDLDNDEWSDDLSEFIVNWWEGDQDKDIVHFDEAAHVPLAEAAKSLHNQDHSYTLAVDTGALYVAQEEAEIDTFMILPDYDERDYYVKGDYPKTGTRDYMNVRWIQHTVGIDYPDIDGQYGEQTRQAVIEWQNWYNEEKKYTPENEDYLSPTGAWGESENIAYISLSKPKHGHTIEMKLGSEDYGAATTLFLGPDGIEMDIAGDIEYSIQGQVFYHNSEQNIDKELMALRADEVEIPVIITSIGEDGKEIKYELGREKYGIESFYENYADGKITGDITLVRGRINPHKQRCATFVTEIADFEGGRYTYYGPEHKSFAQYTGQTGKAWTMSYNIREAGGESLWWVEEEDPDYQFGDTLLYDQSNFQAGDVLGVSYVNSKYLELAEKEGINNRRNSHVMKVIGKEAQSLEVHDIKHPDVTTYIAEELKLDPFYVHGIPMWVNGKKIIYDLDSGDYYPEGAKTPPVGEPVILQDGDTIVLERTVIGQMLHTPGDLFPTMYYDDFFTNDQDFGLYEHMRPDEEKYAEIKNQGTAIVVESKEDIENQLRAVGYAEKDIPVMMAYTDKINNLPAREIQNGDVIYLPTPAETTTTEAIADSLDATITYPQHLIEMIGASAKERVKEYNLDPSAEGDLAEAALYLGMQESYWYETQYKPAQEKLLLEKIAAKTGIVTETTSLGPMQLQMQRAQRNALALEELFSDSAELESIEGGTKHGVRHLARIWEQYDLDTRDDLSYDEKIGIAAAAYHINEYAPEVTAMQSMLHDLGYAEERDIDGYMGEQTLDILESYSSDLGLEFDRSTAQNDCAYYGTNVRSCEHYILQSDIFKEIKAEWEINNKKSAPDVMIPPNNGYVKAVYTHCLRSTGVCTEEDTLKYLEESATIS